MFEHQQQSWAQGLGEDRLFLGTGELGFGFVAHHGVFMAGPAGAEHPEAHPGHDRGQPGRPGCRCSLAPIGVAHPGLLHRVLGLGEGSEHAVGHRLQSPAVGFELRSEIFVHGCQNRRAERPVCDKRLPSPSDQGPGRKAVPSFVPRRCHISGVGHVEGGMTARMNNPAQVLPDSMKGIQSIIEAAHERRSTELHHGTRPFAGQPGQRVRPFVYSGAISAKRAGESDERLFAVAAWRETDLLTDAERAALTLAESMTRLADRPDPVPDQVWDEAAKHFDEKQMAGLVLWVATTNLFNRLNATTKQPAGAAW